MILSTHGIIGSSIVQVINPLLDDYPNAAAAYSLRLLRTAYTGSAIRVRRASDNTEQNIGFTALGGLDTSSLTTFCSGTNGFVTTWYDQSGNGRDATQTTAANQPQIVSSGSVILDNGKPAVQFDGVNDGFTNNLSGSSSNYYLIGVANYTSGRILSSYFTTTIPLNFVASYASTNYSFFARNASGTNTFLSGATATNNQVLQIAYLTSSSAGLLINNNTSVTSSPSLGSIAIGNGFGIGRDVFTASYNNGKIQEAIIYLSNETSNTSGIQTNINSFYSIY